MDQTVIIAVAVIVVIALLLLLLLRGRKQHVTLSDQVAPPRAAAPAPPAAPKVVVAEPAPIVLPEGPAVGEAAPAPAPAGDVLTTLKGLGPKAASRLGELGVTSFAQIASWDDQQVEAIDAQMGNFKGRIQRDRWVEQAQLLAAGDVAGFEEKFGKLGG